MKALDRVDYEDLVSVQCPEGLPMNEILFSFFSFAPTTVKALMAMRNKAVSAFGLKARGHPTNVKRSDIREGNSIGLFEIALITPTKAVMGADDSHLNFRVILEVKGTTLQCLTQIQYNNLMGRCYFSLVKPFHHVVVPTMLKAAVAPERRGLP